MEGFRRGSEQGLEPPLMKIGVDGRSIMVLKLYSIYWAFEPLLILCASTWMYKACQCAAFQHNHAGAGPSPELHMLFYQLVGLYKAGKTGQGLTTLPRPWLPRAHHSIRIHMAHSKIGLFCLILCLLLTVIAGTWRS